MKPQFPPGQEDDSRIDSRRLLREDTKFAERRITASYYLICAVFLFLVFGFWELQIRSGDYYVEAADRNRIKSVPLMAPRGKILDRDGRVIVDNHASYRLLLSRETLKHAHLKPIAEGLNLDYEELEAKLKRFDRTRPKYEPMPIKDELTAAELAFADSHRDPETFPEMEIVESHTRVYPAEGLASHVTGYVGEISDNELNSDQFGRSKPGDIVGKAGIERQYNDLLSGIDGQRQVMVDNRGNERLVLGYKPAEPGRNLQLTVDLDLQVVAELAMEGRRGSVVALDPRNGEVLALVSHPVYDANKMSGRISTASWKEIVSNPGKPLLNRALQAQLAPGSTFKPVVALAALETGSIEDNYAVTCTGAATYYGVTHACHQKGGHGPIRLNEAISKSCDVFFYATGHRTGIDNIARYAEMAGLGVKSGIDLPYELAGLVPSKRWKVRTQREKWYAGETISVAIGQGALTVTPLQLARAIGGLAAGGVWHRPHLVKEAQSTAAAHKASLGADHLLRVIQGMSGVVNAGGTAARARIPGIEMCGKTGSAQVVSLDLSKANKTNRDYADNAWFVGFAPKDSAEIVVVALFEGGVHGDRAAPIVRDVVKAYFDKKKKLEQNARTVAMQTILRPPGAGQEVR
ncbi:MAG: penicillin-binding protein 2 [Candidatus Solibacter usitatus]|nr:penicillin-binding protein 2 [Candidatus Solibacter usitatus]